MHFYLLRHAQSEWQLQVDSGLDTQLTLLGHEQAKRVSASIRSSPCLGGHRIASVGMILSSPLTRAIQTAAYCAKGLDLDLTIVEELEEARFHVADDLPESSHPFEPATVFSPSARYRAFKEQATTALHKLVSCAESVRKPVLVVTHGGLIKTLLRVIMANDHMCFSIGNTSLTLLEWHRGRWHIGALNMLDHLPPDLRS